MKINITSMIFKRKRKTIYEIYTLNFSEKYGTFSQLNFQVLRNSLKIMFLYDKILQ